LLSWHRPLDRHLFGYSHPSLYQDEQLIKRLADFLTSPVILINLVATQVQQYQQHNKTALAELDRDCTDHVFLNQVQYCWKFSIQSKTWYSVNLRDGRGVWDFSKPSPLFKLYTCTGVSRIRTGYFRGNILRLTVSLGLLKRHITWVCLQQGKLYLYQFVGTSH